MSILHNGSLSAMVKLPLENLEWKMKLYFLDFKMFKIFHFFLKQLQTL